jgi:hypothetical protein
MKIDISMQNKHTPCSDAGAARSAGIINVAIRAGAGELDAARRTVRDGVKQEETAISVFVICWP